MAKSQKVKSSKMRKVGRNKLYCAHYRATNRREKNKLRRLVKHLVHHVDDACASKAADDCRRAIRGY